MYTVNHKLSFLSNFPHIAFERDFVLKMIDSIYTISTVDIHNYFITKEGVSKHLWTKENLKTNDF